MPGDVPALFVEAALGAVVGDWVVVGDEELVLLTDYCVEMGGEHAAESCTDDYDVVLLEVVGGGFALFAEAESVDVPGEQLLCCNLTH